MTLAYANRSRSARTVASVSMPTPRNMRAVEWARERGEALVVSYVGETPYPNPTIYCDSGVHYDWRFAEGLRVVIVSKPGIRTMGALPALLRYCTDLGGQDYPTLIDLENREVSSVMHGSPVGLWQIKRGTELWLQYFKT